MIICNAGMIRSLINAAQKSRLGKKSFIGARKRKITKFAVCVVICFIVCWLPGTRLINTFAHTLRPLKPSHCWWPWPKVNISHVIYAIKEKLFEQQPILEREMPQEPSTLHLITTCVLYLNTIINPLIYAMSASSMRNRILTSIRPRQSSSHSVTEKVSTMLQQISNLFSTWPWGLTSGSYSLGCRIFGRKRYSLYIEVSKREHFHSVMDTNYPQLD